MEKTILSMTLEVENVNVSSEFCEGSTCNCDDGGECMCDAEG